MNEIVNKFLLAGDKFVSEMHLGEPRFTYSACGPFNKNKEGIQKFVERGDSRYIYKNELDKACFQRDMADGDFKDLARRTASDKVLRDKAFNIAKNPKYDEHQRGIAPVVYKFFDKMSGGSGFKFAIKNGIKHNEQSAEQLHKPNFRKSKKIKLHLSFKIWGADLVDMQLISKYDRGIKFLLQVTDIFSKYAWVGPLKDKKGITIPNDFKKILHESGHKPNKIWVNESSEFHNRSRKSW